MSFETGKLYVSTAVVDTIGETKVFELFLRHAQRDFGDIGIHWVRANEEAIRKNGRVISEFSKDLSKTVLVITELSLGITTVLYADEFEPAKKDVKEVDITPKSER